LVGPFKFGNFGGFWAPGPGQILPKFPQVQGKSYSFSGVGAKAKSLLGFPLPGVSNSKSKRGQYWAAIGSLCDFPISSFFQRPKLWVPFPKFQFFPISKLVHFPSLNPKGFPNFSPGWVWVSKPKFQTGEGSIKNQNSQGPSFPKFGFISLFWVRGLGTRGFPNFQVQQKGTRPLVQKKKGPHLVFFSQTKTPGGAHIKLRAFGRLGAPNTQL